MQTRKHFRFVGCSLTHLPTRAGQICRFAPISPPASAAMLAEPWGYGRENFAPLVLVDAWAARPRRPALVVVSGCAPVGLFANFRLSFFLEIFMLAANERHYSRRWRRVAAVSAYAGREQTAPARL